jgi:hypothetical protein
MILSSSSVDASPRASTEIAPPLQTKRQWRGERDSVSAGGRGRRVRAGAQIFRRDPGVTLRPRADGRRRVMIRRLRISKEGRRNTGENHNMR